MDNNIKYLIYLICFLLSTTIFVEILLTPTVLLAYGMYLIVG